MEKYSIIGAGRCEREELDQDGSRQGLFYGHQIVLHHPGLFRSDLETGRYR
jgi:hypothetical protein